MNPADLTVEELREIPVGRRLPTRLNYTHDAMIDLVIANPGISQNQIAAHFGYTAPWVSTIFASDAFRERLAARRAELVDPTIVASVEERFRALALKSFEVLMTKLSAPVVADNVALRAAELGAKGLGLGGHAPPPPVAGHLEALAARLTTLGRQTRERSIDGEATVVSREA